ncbi:MAG TPA: DivIVA domain-containing protein [Proteobacteria bacterium]|nr:DivIVA domain-containing protein [Pseudomonadota bacterium]
MRITPMDIQQQEFRVRFRGFDTREVDSFLELVAEELKEASHENSALKDEVKRLRETQANFEEKEKTFQTAFVSAQRVVDEMKSNAERQAKLIVTQAELEAKKMVENAHVQAAQIQEEINHLKRQKAQMEYRVKSFIESLSKWLVSETEPPDCSEKKVAEEEETDTNEAHQSMSAINEIISGVDLEGEDPAK